MGITYLKVPFSEKYRVKKLGAKWDSTASACRANASKFEDKRGVNAQLDDASF